MYIVASKSTIPSSLVPVRGLDLILNSIRLIDSQQQNLIENEDSRGTGTDPLAILPDSSYIAFVTETPMIFLTSTDHGCVYTLSQEDGDELYYAPINSNGNVNLEEFAPVDMNEIDMDQMDVYDIIRQLKVMNEV